MKKLPLHLSMLLFFIALLIGFYLNIPLIENLIRSFVIYLIFSVLILLIYLINNQSAYNMVREELQKGQNPHRKSAESSTNNSE